MALIIPKLFFVRLQKKVCHKTRCMGITTCKSLDIVYMIRKKHPNEIFYFFCTPPIMMKFMTENNYIQKSPEPPEKFVRNRYIQEKLGVSAKTVRRWAKQFEWETLNINSRVVRFLQSDVEKSMGVSLD